MQSPKTAQTITPETLNQWIADHDALFLFDTLTDDHYKKSHLPGALNACVFRVDFLDQIRQITLDKRARMVVYGASEQSMEAAVAAEKLNREGYTNVAILDGGIRAWQAAGLALEGESSAPPPPENLLTLNDGTYRVDVERSVIEWAGRNPNTKHDGTIRLTSGKIIVEGGHPTGTFTIDMNAIENKSLVGDDMQPVLLDHLKSDDFFFSRLFPKATFTIHEGRPRKTVHLSAPNIDITGELTLRGITADLSFAATAVQGVDETITARAQFDLDRTRWNIIYGSARFFEHLGMHLVFDHISIDLKIVAEKVS